MIHRWSGIPALAMVVAACGGAAPANDDPAATPEAPVATPAGDGGTGGGTADGPVVVTVDGTAYGFPIGTCDVGPGHVVVGAGMGTGTFATVDVQWTEANGGSGTDQQFYVVNTTVGAAAPAPFELYADSGRPGTSWEVTVDGTTAVIAATMVDELPATVNPDNPVYRDVTITVDCAERGFGGMAPGPAFSPDVPAGELPTTAPADAATIAVTVDGTSYTFDVAACPITDAGIAANATDGAGGLVFISGLPSAYDLFLGLGGGTAFEASGLDIQVADREASWSGTLPAVGGGEASVAIAISCP